MNSNRSFFKNQLACIVAGFVGAAIAVRVGLSYLSFIPPKVTGALAVAFLLTTIVYGVIWRYRQKRGLDDDEQKLAFWEGLTRYLLAFDMFFIGVGKIFHAQFRVQLGLYDNPISSINTNTLMWVFFGQHYSYPVMIAVLQMTAGLLLMFRKTRLFGLIFLLPILLNIVVLNYYYDFGWGVSTYTIILTLAAIYLMMLEYERLKQFFFIEKPHLPVYHFKGRWQKDGLRILLILIPLVLVKANHMKIFYPKYIGIYDVKTLTVNGKLVPRPTSSRDSTLTTIFIDKDDNDFVMDYNDYRRRLVGAYTFDPSGTKFTVIWRWPRNLHDTLTATFTNGNKPDERILAGRMGKDTLRIVLRKRK